MTDEDAWTVNQRTRVQHHIRWRLLDGARALSLGLLMAVAGSLIGWGAQHHAWTVVIDGAAVALLSVAVMLLNWKLGR